MGTADSHIEVELKEIGRRTSDVIGIDFGTTFSSAAFISPGGACTMIKHHGDQDHMPSVVSINPDTEELEVGIVNPRWPGGVQISQIKRLIGRSFHDPVVQHMVKQVELPFTIVDDGGLPAVVVQTRHGKRTYSPQLLEAKILEEVKKNYAKHFGKTIGPVVLSVPASYDESQKAETLAGAEIADLNVSRIAPEPVLAAYYHYYMNSDVGESTVAVVDIGGGTTDVTLLKKRGLVFEVLAYGGDMHLGGVDFTECVFDWLKQKMPKNHLHKCARDPWCEKRMYDIAEEVKKQLSFESRHVVHVEWKDGPLVLRRDQFEVQCKYLFDRIVPVLSELVGEATRKNPKFMKGDVADVLLVGGSSKMPKVEQIVHAFFGRRPLIQFPLEGVTCGAAVYGHLLKNDASESFLRDVLPYSLGSPIVSEGHDPDDPNTWRGDDRMNVVFRKGEEIPISRQFVTRTGYHNPNNVVSDIYVGEHPLVKDNVLVKKFIIDGPFPGQAGEQKFIEDYSVDKNGVLTLTVRFDPPLQGKDSVHTSCPVGLLPHQFNTSMIQRQSTLHSMEVQLDVQRRTLRTLISNARNVADRANENRCLSIRRMAPRILDLTDALSNFNEGRASVLTADQFSENVEDLRALLVDIARSQTSSDYRYSMCTEWASSTSPVEL